MMTTIPNETKTELKKPGTRFNRAPLSESSINGGLLAVAKRAVGNAIKDDEPYTIRINFRNGRIVGDEANPRLSVELLDGRASTTHIGTPEMSNIVYVEFKYLQTENYPAITNGDSWVARAKIDGDTIVSATVNNDFSEEDRELIKTVLMRGFVDRIQM